MQKNYVSLVRIFLGTSDSSKRLEHRNMEMVLVCIGIGRQVLMIKRVGMKRSRG